MTMRYVPDTGLVFDGHDTGRDELLTQTRQWLVDQGVHHIEADDATTPQPHLVARGWWGDDERGFVQQHHDGAQPVTVVHVHLPEATS